MSHFRELETMKSLNEDINAIEGPRPIQAPVMHGLVRLIQRAWEAVRVLLKPWEAVCRPQKALWDFVASAIARPLVRVLLRMSEHLAPEPELVEKLSMTLTDLLLGAALKGAVAALV
jgi:hypothetical protein